MKLFRICLFLIPILSGCDKKDNDNPTPNPPGPGPGPGTGVNITSTSPEYVVWGEELTINGTGLSANKSDYTIKFITDAACVDTFQTIIYSATSSQVKIKSPIGSFANGKKCGPSFASVIVSVNGKSDTAAIQMVGWPRIQNFCNHYGLPDPPGLSRTGDSVILDVEGATGVFASNHPNRTGFKISINDTVVNYQWRPSCNGIGAAMVIPIDSFARIECGAPYRSVLFKAFIPGTEIFDTARLNIYYLPRQLYQGVTGPATVSKSAGGNPEWEFTGRSMYFDRVRFIAENCAAQPVEIPVISPPIQGKFYQEGSVYIPLSVMLAPCKYRVLALTPCDEFQLLGFIQIDP